MSYTDYVIIPEKQLIIEHFSGEINLDVILELKKRASHDEAYDRNFNIIDDSRNAKFSLNIADVREYIEHISKNDLLNGERYAAYITETPNQVVVATLFNELKNTLPISVSIVSTVDAALARVKLSMDDKEIVEQNLEKLRKHSYAINQINQIQ